MTSKIDIILQYALEEFSEQGYRKASTNRIIQKADTSKGILFHYFGSKKGLYLQILDQCLDQFEAFLNAELSEMPEDILERYVTISTAKVKMFMKYPTIYKLVVSAFQDTPEELRAELAEREQRIKKQGEAWFRTKIDTSRFRETFVTERALEIVASVLEMKTRKFMEEFGGLPDRGTSRLLKVTKEFEEIITILKIGIYKPQP
ncbi:TetR/AcrR family transcriptional regulator [Paenibacillus sp. A14]|uniref:TetR/AcrR family transcriptional regulator n=1 Tax=Paenibacillus sp. A14 TaxID=3119820 RepID=UPI002FE075E7